MTQCVYKLKCDVNNYEVFGLFNKDDWDVLEMLDNGEPVADKWHPIRVRPRPPSPAELRMPGDFPYLGSIIPMFSGRAVEALRDVLEPNGELLALDCLEGVYCAYNLLTIIDALDQNRSDLKRFPSSGRIMLMNRYEFNPELLDDAVIFALPDMRGRRFVTDEFVQRVRSAGLLGFEFHRVWSVAGDVPVVGDL